MVDISTRYIFPDVDPNIEIKERENTFIVNQTKLFVSMSEILKRTQDPSLILCCCTIINSYKILELNTIKAIAELFLLKGYVYVVKILDSLYNIEDTHFLNSVVNDIISSNLDTNNLVYVFYYLFDSGILPHLFTRNKNLSPISKRNIAVFFTNWRKHKEDE